MKKLFKIMIAIVMMTINSSAFAQKIDQNTYVANLSNDANKRLIARVADALFADDCKDCLFPASIQVIKITKTIQDYKKLFSWDCPDPSRTNLRSDFIDRSEIIYGSDVKGMMLQYKINDDGYGYSLERYYPSGSDKFIAYRGMPYIKVEGVPSAPKTSLVVSNTTPSADVPAPMVAQTPKPVAPVVVPTPTVAAQQAPAAGCTTIVNNYISDQQSNDAPYFVGQQAIVPIGYTIQGAETPYYAQPRTYGVPMGGYGYGGYGSNVSVSVWWNGASYYPYNNYWYCRNTGNRVCNNDYNLLCKKFGTPGNQQNTNTYNGPRSNTKAVNSNSGNASYNAGNTNTVSTYGNNANNYVPTNSVGYGQPKTYGVAR